MCSYIDESLYRGETVIESCLLNMLTFVNTFSFPQCPETACPYECIFITPDMNTPHLHLFHQVCNSPWQLELAPVLDSKRARSFIEDLRCREV